MKKSFVFPKNFFTKVRTVLSFDESVLNDKEFVWSNGVLDGKSKVKIVGVKEKNSKN